MNFKKLQAMQLELDNSILSAKLQMTAEERFNKTLVALSVEVAEVANCAEHFKFWKDNKGKVDSERFITTIDFMFEDEIRNDKRKHELLKDTSHLLVDSSKKYNLDNLELLTVKQAHKLTLVEECSDALHFILSLANQLKVEIGGFNLISTNSNKEIAYLLLQANITDTIVGISEPNNEWLSRVVDWFYYYITELGVTEQELEQAYYDKNKVNYERLREGY